MKKIIIVAIILVVALGGIFLFFSNNKKGEFNLSEVSKGTVIKEVSETGVVRKVTEKVELSFKNSGRIEEVLVKAGDEVEAGQALVKLEIDDLYLQLKEAQAILSSSQADYNKLLAGVTEEKVRVTQADVDKAKVVLEDKKQNLEDVKTDAEEDLNNALQDALSVLNDTYLELYDSYNLISYLQRTYFYSSTQKAAEIKYRIKGFYNRLEEYIDSAEESLTEENVDLALSGAKGFLDQTSDDLETLRNLSDSSAYVNTVSTTDKSSIDTQKSAVNSTYTDVVNAQQDISTTKINNTTNINNAQSSVSSAQADFKKAEEELTSLTADPRQEDIQLYQAKVNQAGAKVSLLQNKLEEATLKSSHRGQIAKVEKEEGEVVQAQEKVVSLLPTSPFIIKVDIYEEDIVNVKVGNPVRIDLVAFPEKTLGGEVTAINPAEKMVEGIVYYETTIDFKEVKEGIKPGMTTDIVIETNKKEDVLVIPKEVVKKEDGKTTVRVFSKGKLEEREIKIGLEGEDLIEVVSGLEEGEEVIIE